MKHILFLAGIAISCLIFSCKKDNNGKGTEITRLHGKWYWDTVTTQSYVNNIAGFPGRAIFSGTTDERFEFRNDGTVLIRTDITNEPDEISKYSYDAPSRQIAIFYASITVFYQIREMTDRRMVITFDYTYTDGPDTKRETGRYELKKRD